MTTIATGQTAPKDALHAPFGSVLCGVDGSRTSLEAARQAAALCVPDGSLRLLAVTWEIGVGANAQAALSRWRADRVLIRARALAGELGVRSEVRRIAAADEADQILDQAKGFDLIAVGIHGQSRMGGIVIGSTATALLHRSAVPILAARRPPTSDFGQSILLAVDGTPSCLAAAAVAGRIARCTGGRAAIVCAPSRDAATRHILAETAMTLREATGTEPVIIDERGAAPRAVAAAAAMLDASLVVTGSRGLTGARAVHSVSERIAHAAPCSVLVVRGER